MLKKTIFLLDKQSVPGSRGAEYHLNPAGKHPENPVISPGYTHEIDSLQVSWPISVIYDAEYGKFRCWYGSCDAIPERRPPRIWEKSFTRVCYAESNDGIHWEKPPIGNYLHMGRPSNAIAVDWEGKFAQVFLNPDQSDPSRKFLSMWKEFGKKGDPAGGDGNESVTGKSLAYSADGIHWSRIGLFYKAEDGAQDINCLMYDPDSKDEEYRVKGYSQVTAKISSDKKRKVGLVHGRSLEKVVDYPGKVIMDAVEGIDNEIHFSSVNKIGGKYFMIFESDRFSAEKTNGDLRLAVSEDGIGFRRVHPREALIPNGEKGTWDEGVLMSGNSGIIEVGDTWYIYYIGHTALTSSWPRQYSRYGPRFRGMLYYPSWAGLATLPKDSIGYATAKNGGTAVLELAKIRLEGGEKVMVNAEGPCEGLEIYLKGRDGAIRGVPSGRLAAGRYVRIYFERTPEAGRYKLEAVLNGDLKLYSCRIGQD